MDQWCYSSISVCERRCMVGSSTALRLPGSLGAHTCALEALDQLCPRPSIVYCDICNVEKDWNNHLIRTIVIVFVCFFAYVFRTYLGSSAADISINIQYLALGLSPVTLVLYDGNILLKIELNKRKIKFHEKFLEVNPEKITKADELPVA